MADVHNFNPTALDIAKVVRTEASARLEGPINTPARCVSAAFATSGKDRPVFLDDHALFVLLAEAVIRQAEEIAGLKKHINTLDNRTIGSVPMGPAAENHRHAVADAKRSRAMDELRERMEANPEWVAARAKLNADLAARRAARESGSPPATADAPDTPPHPTGGMGE